MRVARTPGTQQISDGDRLCLDRTGDGYLTPELERDEEREGEADPRRHGGSGLLNSSE